MKAKRILKKALSVALCAALLGGTAVMLPAVSSEVAVTADAAEVYGDFKYMISGDEVIITEYNRSGGDVTIPDKIDGKPVTSIGWGAFRGCTGLTSITIPDSVTSIGEYAFEYCTGLTSITIPDSVISIGSGAFVGCTGLTSIMIPDSVTSIGDDAFYDTAWYDNKPDGLVYAGKVAYKFKGEMEDNTKIVLKSGTKGIADSAFSGCTGLTSITIPDSVTSISAEAFSRCTGLTSITIPDSVTSIGWRAFEDCTGLTSITIPDSVTSIGSNAFEDCTGLTSITIPDSVTSIGYEAFSGCTGLTSITIPDSVTSIGYEAFSGCTGLTSITIPDSVISIGSGAFEGCTGLTSIMIPDSVTSIGDDAFYDTAWYDNKPDGLVYAGKVAYKFKGEMEDNTKIVLKSGTKGIADSAFSGCTGLTSITIPDSVASIGYRAFDNCTGLKSITIPDSVTSIGGRAFYDCTGLISVTIPDSVTSIGDQAFGCYWNDDLCDSMPIDGFTIYGKKDSATEKYAADNGFKFVETDFPLKNASSISSDSIKLNETITLTAKASGGTSPYTYAFMYKAPGATSWKVIGTKFGTSDTESFKPTKAGTYEILISVKDSTGKSVAKKFALTVTAPVVYASKSTINATDVTCGTKIILTGAAEGGTEPYYYTYQYQKPGKTSWITLGDKYGTAESANFTPKVAGTYKARVLVKDGKGTVKSSVFTVNVTGELLVNKSTISAAEVTTGTKVTITSATTGGTEPFYYTYEYKAPSASKWTTIGKRNSANTTASFTPTSTGTYEARVYIKDAGGFVTVKNFKVTVK